MKPLKARIRLNFGLANDPSMELLVDKLPRHDELIYKEIPCGGGRNFYFSETGGYVNFYLHDPRDQVGFGGTVFDLKLESGEIKRIKGPWSSSPSSVKSLNLPDCVDAAVIDDVKSYERGYTFYACHITLELAKEACKIAVPDKQDEFLKEQITGYCIFPVVKSYGTVWTFGAYLKGGAVLAKLGSFSPREAGLVITNQDWINKQITDDEVDGMSAEQAAVIFA